MLISFNMKTWNNKKIILVFLILLSGILPAISDGLYDEGKKQLSKIIESIGYINIMLIGAVYKKLIGKWIRDGVLIVGSIICARIVFFNATYNIVRGLDIWYFGTTSIYDKVMINAGAFYPVVVILAFVLYLSFINHLEDKQ